MSIGMFTAFAVLCVIAVVCGFIFTLYKVELLDKEIGKVIMKCYNLGKKIDDNDLKTLQRLGETQELVENSLDHSHDVLNECQKIIEQDKEIVDSIKKVIHDSEAIRQQARDILNGNIEICEMCEELKESCQQLLKTGCNVDVKGEDAV